MGGLAEAVAAALAAATAAAEVHSARLEDLSAEALGTVQIQTHVEPDTPPTPSEPASVAEMQGRFEEVLAAASNQENVEDEEDQEPAKIGAVPVSPQRATARSCSPHLAAAAAAMERCRSLAELDPDALRGI
eukprot:3631268-Amphidinium_carterae.1